MNDPDPREREQIRHLFAVLRTLGKEPDPIVRRDSARLAGELLDLAGAGPRGDAVLTDREIDVLALAAIGTRNGEAADRLRLSPETVKSYLRSAMTKLGVHSRHAAVAAAREIRAIP